MKITFQSATNAATTRQMRTVMTNTQMTHPTQESFTALMEKILNHKALLPVAFHEHFERMQKDYMEVFRKDHAESWKNKPFPVSADHLTTDNAILSAYWEKIKKHPEYKPHNQ